jgi:hypothetical protein
MNDSILNDIKKLLGIEAADTSFDIDIIVAINTAILALTQIGVGPLTGYVISSSSDSWKEFIKDDTLLESVKSYIFIKTKFMFDPPQNSALTQAYQNSLNEIEWRLQHVIEVMEVEEDG